jgi:hypothetical protein
MGKAMGMDGDLANNMGKPGSRTIGDCGRCGFLNLGHTIMAILREIGARKLP